VIADELRSVATELRPPVLDDLGLAAAIEFVAEKETSGALAIDVELQDLSGLTAATRPPSGVELAVFRIAQEAISNAVRHAHAGTVRVTGTVGPDRIDLEIVDDGQGLNEGEARSAARRGRLGLASMRRRAEAIDADLSVVGSSTGTIVRVRWQR
jgi:two-component system NarL family sensor kinase